MVQTSTSSIVPHRHKLTITKQLLQGSISRVATPTSSLLSTCIKEKIKGKKIKNYRSLVAKGRIISLAICKIEKVFYINISNYTNQTKIENITTNVCNNTSPPKASSYIPYYICRIKEEANKQSYFFFQIITQQTKEISKVQ